MKIEFLVKPGEVGIFFTAPELSAGVSLTVKDAAGLADSLIKATKEAARQAAASFVKPGRA